MPCLPRFTQTDIFVRVKRMAICCYIAVRITSSFWIARYLVTDSSVEHELFQEGHISSAGTSMSRPEIEAVLAERFPRRPYCLVEDWLLFHVDEPPESLARVRSVGLQPMFLYSHCVTYDSQGRFPPGGWVRSTLCKTYDGVCMFETRNTVYVLIGQGREQTASLKTIFSLC